jgi:hypothetical protein
MSFRLTYATSDRSGNESNPVRADPETAKQIMKISQDDKPLLEDTHNAKVKTRRSGSGNP